MNPQALIAKAVGAFLVLVLSFALGYTYRDGKADKEALAQQNTHLIQLNKEREALQGALDEISGAWHAENRKVQGDADRTIATLRSDGIRLRVQLADAVVSSVTGNSGSDPDGRAELHPDASRFLVGEAKRADAQVRALQETVRKLQGGQDAKTKD
ncbi:lysis system i-spanin subunit Rz [Stutzerimonas stutzeri]|uniref:lysis system i-spanin subunit Rz n=1 Tax=Stutzerimonas stutzeri TaxID=316 RepID=UPI0030AB79B7